VRASRLPSGWTPLEVLKHLVYMEQRWLRWGFYAEQLPIHMSPVISPTFAFDT
jgi:hypothetical protein